VLLMVAFDVFPAIDLRGGRVVRLVQGDPNRQTVYSDNPVDVAREWFASGARWLHVVNLDGAFGEGDVENRKALKAILRVTTEVAHAPRVQFGGGLRSSADVERVISLGVSRAILGTAAIETPDIVAEMVARFGPERVAVGIDARNNRVRVRGWSRETQVDPAALGRVLYDRGLRVTVYTNIARDGAGSGVDVAATQRLAEATELRVIASGGVASLKDVQRVRSAGLGGVIIGRALYEGKIDLREALQC
jgi:phosphoribosylformimino-5-aminoimidazole carboxamide ribotide isomerase